MKDDYYECYSVRLRWDNRDNLRQAIHLQVKGFTEPFSAIEYVKRIVDSSGVGVLRWVDAEAILTKEFKE